MITLPSVILDPGATVAATRATISPTEAPVAAAICAGETPYVAMADTMSASLIPGLAVKKLTISALDDKVVGALSVAAAAFA